MSVKDSFSKSAKEIYYCKRALWFGFNSCKSALYSRKRGPRTHISYQNAFYACNIAQGDNSIFAKEPYIPVQEPYIPI